jgi:hypothetical protein
MESAWGVNTSHDQSTAWILDFDRRIGRRSIGRGQSGGDSTGVVVWLHRDLDVLRAMQ